VPRWLNVQKPYLRPNCTIRGVPVIDVIRPNVPALKLVTGFPQLNVLSRLNASTRTSRLCAPPKATSLDNAASTDQYPGPWMLLRA
jgi:hypothetical protein